MSLSQEDIQAIETLIDARIQRAFERLVQSDGSISMTGLTDGLRHLAGIPNAVEIGRQIRDSYKPSKGAWWSLK